MSNPYALQMTTYSMMPAQWLEELFTVARHVQKVRGAIVECGVFNGGSAVMLTLGAGAKRRVWLFDSWEGLPGPTIEDGQRAAYRYALTGNKMDVGDERQVLAAFGVAGLNKPRLVRGWFADTFPLAETGHLALLHIDADWYASTRLALEKFYPLLNPGGLCIVHDYNCWPGTHRAVDEFLADKPEIRLTPVARSGVWWRIGDG